MNYFSKLASNQIQRAQEAYKNGKEKGHQILHLMTYVHYLLNFLHIPLYMAANSPFSVHIRCSMGSVYPPEWGNEKKCADQSTEYARQQVSQQTFRPLHGLRHTFASMLASSGQVDPYTLQKLLTHKSPTMTQRYAHLRDEALQRAADLAGDLLGQVINGNKSIVGALED